MKEYNIEEKSFIAQNRPEIVPVEARLVRASYSWEDTADVYCYFTDEEAACAFADDELCIGFELMIKFRDDKKAFRRYSGGFGGTAQVFIGMGDEDYVFELSPSIIVTEDCEEDGTFILAAPLLIRGYRDEDEDGPFEKYEGTTVFGNVLASKVVVSNNFVAETFEFTASFEMKDGVANIDAGNINIENVDYVLREDVIVDAE